MHTADELADIEAYDRAMAEPGEAIPAEFVRRMVDGESPLRVFRDLRRLTQLGLAERSGVNRVQIADIEAGRKSGSVQTLRKLGEALWGGARRSGVRAPTPKTAPHGCRRVRR